MLKQNPDIFSDGICNFFDFRVKVGEFSISNRSSHSEVFLEKGVPKICSKFTGEHAWQSVISIKLQSNFIEMTLRYGCSSVNLVHSFRTLFPKTPVDGCF